MLFDNYSLIICGYIFSLFCDCLSSIIVSTERDAYNKFVIVFWCYFSKFIISLIIYFIQNYNKCENVWRKLWQNCVQNSSIFLLYSVPSFLYLLADILWYFNLSNINPVTFSMLWQFRIVCTAVIHQILFSRLLSRVQWIALILLTTGCLLKQVDTSLANIYSTEAQEHIEMSAYLLVLAQILCSCFAGVYNEYLLKGTNDSKLDDKKSLDLMIQNMFMYSNSMIFDLIIISIVSQFSEIPEFLSQVIFTEPKLTFVLFNTTFLGLMTSLFLKNLDSVFRTFGAVFQIIFTAILSCLLLNITINFMTLVSIVIVIISLIIYVNNPVISDKVVVSSDYNSIEFKEKLLTNESNDEKV